METSVPWTGTTNHEQWRAVKTKTKSLPRQFLFFSFPPSQSLDPPHKNPTTEDEYSNSFKEFIPLEGPLGNNYSFVPRQLLLYKTPKECVMELQNLSYYITTWM